MFKNNNWLSLRVVLVLTIVFVPLGFVSVTVNAETVHNVESKQSLFNIDENVSLEEDDCSGMMWTNGPLEPEIASQVQMELGQIGIEAIVEARSYGETDRCGTYTPYGIDFTVNLKSEVSMEQSTQQTLGDSIFPVLSEYGKPNLGNVKLISPQGEVSHFNSPSKLTTLHTLDADALPIDAITKNVYVVVYDPLLSNGQNLIDYMNWSDPATLTQQITDFFRQASSNKVNFSVVETTIVTDGWPELIDGFSYSDEEYLAVLFGEQPHHEPTGVDYNKFVEDPVYNICGKVNRGEIDEVWVYGAPWFGFYESRLVGLGGYKFNSIPVIENDCAKMVPIMGFSVERHVNEAVHNFTHRAEATMTKVYGSWQEDRIAHSWDKFGLVKAQSPSFSYSGCGSSHYPPNSGSAAYIYDTPSSVLSNCDDFANYPNLGDPLQVSQPVTCTSWGCTELGYYEYWFSHFPSFSDCGSDAVANDWWEYFADPSLALVPLLACTPPATCPTIITGWQGEYWNNRLLIGLPDVCRDDPNINFDLGGRSPASLIYVDNFSARWERTINFNGGSYRFYMMNDDGARLYVDDIIQLDAWESCCSWKQVDVPISAGDHTVRMEMFEYDGGAVAKLWWEILGQYSPEVDLQGNSVSIHDGDSEPSPADQTDFGIVSVTTGAVSHTFTIYNVGESTLNLTGLPKVKVTGPHATDYTVSVQPTDQVTAAGSTTFTIIFDPSGSGLRTASVSIATSDADENPYNFSIQGMGEADPQALSIARSDPSPTSASSVDFIVTFSEAVTGVDVTDFSLASTATSTSITAVTATVDPAIYIVTVDTGSGAGTIRLDMVADGSIVDGDGNSLDGSFTSGEEYTIVGIYSIDLEAGWNLVSFDLQPLDTEIAALLSSIDGNYNLVYTWDASGVHSESGNWMKYDPTAPAYQNSLDHLDETMGFWIYMLSPETIEIMGYQPTTTHVTLADDAGGWNLVAYPSSIDGALPEALSDHGVDDDFSLAYAYHADDATDPWKLFDRTSAPYANDLPELAPGWGYWIRVSADTDWSVEYSTP